MELFSTLPPAALTDKAKALYYEEREAHKEETDRLAQAINNNTVVMQQVLNMIPGMGNKISKEASKMTEDKIDSYKVMMSSMTEEEMLNPKIIKQSRIQRIARGSGVQESEVKELLKYYNNTKKTMKGIGKRGGRLGGGAMNRMMGQFINR